MNTIAASGETHSGQLPAGFEDLQEFVPGWLGDNVDERWELRASHDMPSIRYFYDKMLSRAEDVLSHVDQFPLNALPPDTLRLYKLLLGLAQASMAVELHNQPRVHHSPYPHKVRVLRGPKLIT